MSKGKKLVVPKDLLAPDVAAQLEAHLAALNQPAKVGHVAQLEAKIPALIVQVLDSQLPQILRLLESRYGLQPQPGHPALPPWEWPDGSPLKPQALKEDAADGAGR